MRNDTIYRQEAIDAIEKLNIPEDMCVFEILSHIEVEIGTLPSAQPDIIRCKDCKWCEDADGLMCKNPASWVVATGCDFGCVLAERRRSDG